MFYTETEKLDYTLKTAAERTNFVDNLLPKLTYDQLHSEKYIEILANYIVSAMTPEEKKNKLILTDNRMITINKRETSMQQITDSLENGEDGLWHITLDNDKNVLLTHKKEITKQDLEEIKALRDLKEAMQIMEESIAKATGKQKYLIKKALIEMHQQQYIIKNSYKPPLAAKSVIKNLTKVDLIEHIQIAETRWTGQWLHYKFI